MYGLLLFNTLIPLLFTCVYMAENETNYQIVPYEYGSHVRGEELSLSEKGYIPPFVPVYILNVTHSRNDLEQRYTYLRVEYLSTMSTVNVLYEPESATISFHITFPFMNIPYGVIGFSVKIQKG